MEVEVVQSGCADTCRSILRALPEWFGQPAALDDYARAATGKPMVLARDAGQVVGYISMARHFGRHCEVHSMGVLKSHHRKNVGRMMMDALARYAQGQGCVFLSVKTLSQNHMDANYARTRAFYEAVGFEPFEELPTLWGENLPCLIMLRVL